MFRDLYPSLTEFLDITDIFISITGMKNVC